MHIKRTEQAYKQTPTRRVHTHLHHQICLPLINLLIEFQSVLQCRRYSYENAHAHTLYLGLRSNELPGRVSDEFHIFSYFTRTHTILFCVQTLCAFFCFSVCVTYTHTLTKAFSGTHTHEYMYHCA